MFYWHWTILVFTHEYFVATAALRWPSGRTQMINSSHCLARTSWPKASLPAGPRWLDLCRRPVCFTLPEKTHIFFSSPSTPLTSVLHQRCRTEPLEPLQPSSGNTVGDLTSPAGDDAVRIPDWGSGRDFCFSWRGNFEWAVHLLRHAGGRSCRCFSGVCVCDWTEHWSDWGRLIIFYHFD